MAVSLAQPRLGNRDYAALHELVEKERVLCRERRFEGYYELNDAFHLRIVEKSANQVLVHYVRELLQKTTIYLILFDPFFQLIDGSNESPGEHLEILELLENKKTEAAGEAMKQHLASTVSGIDLDRLYPRDYLSID